VVLADDHDYDYMSQWVVGVYSSEEDACNAASRDEDAYVKRGGKRSRHNVTISRHQIGRDFVHD